MKNIKDHVQQQDSLADTPKHLDRKLIALISTLSVLLVTFLIASILLYFQVQSLKKQLDKVTNNDTIGQLTTTPTLTTSSLPPTPATSPVPPLSNFTDKYGFGEEIKQEFDTVIQEYQGKLVPNNKASIWWISNDGLNIINNNEVGVEYQNYSCESDFKDNEIFNNVTDKLSAGIKIVMDTYGYSLNQKNSSNSIGDEQFYDYIQAYEKGNTKCIFTTSPDCGTYSDSVPMHYTFLFTCTDSFDKNYEEQSPYLKGLDITKAIININKRIGDFARISVSYRRTGHYTIAKLVNGVWTELYSGQDTPDCETMEKNQVPQEIYGDCYSRESE